MGEKGGQGELTVRAHGLADLWPYLCLVEEGAQHAGTRLGILARYTNGTEESDSPIGPGEPVGRGTDGPMHLPSQGRVHVTFEVVGGRSTERVEVLMIQEQLLGRISVLIRELLDLINDRAQLFSASLGPIGIRSSGTLVVLRQPPAVLGTEPGAGGQAGGQVSSCGIALEEEGQVVGLGRSLRPAGPVDLLRRRRDVGVVEVVVTQKRGQAEPHEPALAGNGIVGHVDGRGGSRGTRAAVGEQERPVLGVGGGSSPGRGHEYGRGPAPEREHHMPLVVTDDPPEGVVVLGFGVEAVAEDDLVEDAQVAPSHLRKRAHVAGP